MLERRHKLSIGIVAALIVVIVCSFFFLAKQKSSSGISTGGSVRQYAGYLVLHGYDVASNQGSKAPLSMYLNVGQQANIRSYLEAILYNNNPKNEYEGSIQPGSFDINFSTNNLTFKVKIEDPELLYIVQFNTIDNKITVFDENNKEIKPSNE